MIFFCIEKNIPEYFIYIIIIIEQTKQNNAVSLLRLLMMIHKKKIIIIKDEIKKNIKTKHYVVYTNTIDCNRNRLQNKMKQKKN